MRISNTSKGQEELIDFGSLDAGDVFTSNGSVRVKLNIKIFHISARSFKFGDPEATANALEILDYDSVCLSTGALCKHEPTTPVRYQPQATVYLKG